MLEWIVMHPADLLILLQIDWPYRYSYPVSNLSGVSQCSDVGQWVSLSQIAGPQTSTTKIRVISNSNKVAMRSANDAIALVPIEFAL